MDNEKIITEKQYDIIWVISYFCNQQCSYCPTKDSHSKEIVRKYNDIEIKNLLNNIKYLNLNINSFKIMGGEPTLHPQLKDICTNVINYFPNENIRIFTNGSKTVKYFDSFKDIKDKIQLTISLHFDYYEKQKELWKEIALYLKENNFNFKYKLMYMLTHKQETFEIAEWLKNNQIEYSFAGLYERCDEKYPLYNYTEEDKQILTSDNKGTNIQSLLISPDSNIFLNNKLIIYINSALLSKNKFKEKIVLK